MEESFSAISWYCINKYLTFISPLSASFRLDLKMYCPIKNGKDLNKNLKQLRGDLLSEQH